MTDWINADETYEWLSDTHLPTSDPPSMLRYIRAKWNDAFQRQLVEKDGEMPQSFAHWWVHSRLSEGEPFKYPTIEHWRQWLIKSQAWRNSGTGADMRNSGTGADIIAMFKTWLDLLFIDITSFEDEGHREGVPRLYYIKGEAHIYVKNAQQKRASRRETVKYIIQQGIDIFQERGFVKGLEWWSKDCKLMNTL